MPKKKLIENWIPLKELSASAMRDKARKGHPGNLHLWWNRSPIDSSTAVLFSALVDEDDTEASELITEIANNHSGAVQSAREYVKSKYLDEGSLVTADPFSGFGGLVIAGKNIGVPVDASDLNSLATLLTKAVAEIPIRFANISAVHPGSQKEFSSGSRGLAGDVSHYGKKIGEEAREILKFLYPEENGKEVFSWIWVRTTECANPACKARMPLGSGFVLSQKKGKEYWAEPILAEGKTTFRIHRGICPKEKMTNKIGVIGAKFVCPFCGEKVTEAYVKEQGVKGNVRNLLMAVAVSGEDGRDFYAPSDRQIRAADVDAPDELPVGKLPDNTRWFSTPAFGMLEYKDLYTSRQLKMLCELSNLIQKYRDVVVSDARKAGMDDDQIGLEDGGKGALAYGQAVSVYLALVLGRMTNYHSTICTWDNRKGNIRASFTRQAIPMTWTFAEGNPFSDATGNYESCLKNVVESIRNLSCGGTVLVTQADGIRRDYSPNSILFTELPYLDNVGYADLSDYFYIWLRKCLLDVYPKLFEKIVTSKEELSSIPEHYGGDARRGRTAYFDGVRKFFLNFAAYASDDYPSMAFYEYSKSDEAMIKNNGNMEKSAWEILLQSIIDAGFQITRVWPIRTEKANDRFESVRVLVVFRKRKAEAQKTTRRMWTNNLRRELPELLDRDYAHGVADEDKWILAMGLGLSVFTRYEYVLNADGGKMHVHDALQLIEQETADYKRAHLPELTNEEIREG